MSGVTRAGLREVLVSKYKRLRSNLARVVGSRDLASEALHEMFIKLSAGGDLSPVADPDGYIFRGALNAARDMETARRRMLDHLEAEALLNLVDETPGPDRIAEAKSELKALREAMRELKPREREILIAVRQDEIDHETLAEKYGISVRMVQMELRAAILHLARRTARKSLFTSAGFRVPGRREFR